MSEENKMAEAEKLATQAETGGGRSMARPGGGADGIGSGPQPGGVSPSTAPLGGGLGNEHTRLPSTEPGSTGMSGQVTNDAMPEGGAPGDKAAPDTIKPGSAA